MMNEKVLDVFYTENNRFELIEEPRGSFTVKRLSRNTGDSQIMFSSKSYHEANEYFEKKIGC